MKAEKEEQEIWICPICDEENPSDEDICQSCGSLREEPAYDAESDLSNEETEEN